MVSSGTLRLLSELADGEIDDVGPTVDGADGEVRYPEAERVVDERDEPAYETLESLARRGICRRTFEEKVYVCPDCDAEGLRFTTVCRDCGSAHTVETELFVHEDCGRAAPRERYRSADADGSVCPHCDEPVASLAESDSRREHVCRDCGSREPRPANGLRCDDCAVIHDPETGIELPLYRYDFGADGEAWYRDQVAARRTIAEELEGRGYDADVDVAVGGEERSSSNNRNSERSGDGEAPEVSRTAGADGDGDGDGAYPVHLRAADDLLGDAVVADVHERPDRDDAEWLRAAAAAVDGRGVLVTTSGEITEGAAEVARANDLRVLRHRGGELDGSYETTEGRTGSTVIQRITAGVRQRLG